MKKNWLPWRPWPIENYGVSGYLPMTEGLKTSYETISGRIETDLNFRKSFQEYTAMTELSEKVIHDKIVESVNIYKELNDFLLQRKSEITEENYRRAITVFLQFCENEKIEPRRVNRKDSEEYLKYLNEKYVPGSVRSMMMAVCSFYQYVMRHHEELFIQNVFLKLELPDNIPTRKKDVVYENDIKVLRREFLKDGKDYFVCLLDIVSKYGLRVGTFLKIVINDDDDWYGVSKGKSIDGKFSKQEVKQIRKTKLLEKPLSTLKIYNKIV